MRWARGIMAAGVVFAMASHACACDSRPFDAYVRDAQARAQSPDVSHSRRLRLEGLLDTARMGEGPAWGGVRQRALNAALRDLGLPEALEPPLDELPPEQREAKLQRLARQTLNDIDALGAAKDEKMRTGAQFDARRQALRALYGDGAWRDVVQRGWQLQSDLGAAPPGKC